jgi:hypothetical protein
MLSRAPTPCFSLTLHHSAAASRRRRGRSSSPTRVAKVCSAGPPVARRRLAQRVRTGQPAAGGGGNDRVDPALDEREQRLQPAQRGVLGRGGLRLEQPAGQGLLDARRIARVDLAHRPFDHGQIDVDALCIGRDGVEHAPAQPRHVREQPLVRRLAQGQVEPHLVGRALQAFAEGRHVGRDERGGPGRPERHADVRRADHLTRQAGEPLPDLGAEHQPADLRHDRADAAGREHCAEVAHRAEPERRELVTELLVVAQVLQALGQLLRARHRLRHRGDDALGHRIAQLAPHRQRGLEPLRACPGLDGVDARGQLRHLVEPEIGQPDRVGDRSPLGTGHARIGTGQSLRRELTGQIPVHRAALPAHHLLPLGEHRHRRAERVRAGIVRISVAAGPEAERELGTHAVHGSSDDRAAPVVPW